MLIENVRELSGLHWELWEARTRLSGSVRPALARARIERGLLERRLAGRQATGLLEAAAGWPREPLPPSSEPEAEAGAVASTDLLVVLLCPDLGRLLEASLESLRRSRPAPREIVVAAASCAHHTEQRLLRLEREGVGVQRAASLGRAANAAIRGAMAAQVLVLRATERLAPGALERCKALFSGEQRSDLVVLTREGSASEAPRRNAASVSLMLAGLAPAATLAGRAFLEARDGLDAEMENGLDLELWLRAFACGSRCCVLPGALEPPGDGASFFAGQAWGDDLERIVARHAALLEREVASEALQQAARTAARDLEEARGALAAAEAELRREQGELARLCARLRSAGQPRVALGELPRSGPLSPEWGAERGKPIDRHYIEVFLRSHEGDVRGRCLEIKEPAYTRWFGAAKVAAWDVLDVNPANEGATIHGDLTEGAGIPDAQYDCFILTQTLHLLYDFRGALRHAVRVLRPGGTLLVSVPAVSRILPEDGGIDTDYWRFTEASMRRLFWELLPLDAFEVRSYGNVLSAAAFLYGLAAEDLEPGELDRVDPHFPVIIGVRARKPA